MRTVTFNSWSEMLDYVRRTPASWPLEQCNSRFTNRYDFTLTRDFEEAMHLAENGWPEGAAKAERLTSALVSKVTSLMEHERASYDVTGRDFDVAAMLSGEPEHWMDYQTVTVEGASPRILRLVINGFVSWQIDTAVIIARGAAIAALIATLELSGARVEVVLNTPFHRDKGRGGIRFSTVLKSPDQPLDLDRLIFAAGHPAMFRRLMFSALEHNPAEREHLSYYGCSTCTLPTEDQGDIYVEGSRDFDRWTDTTAAAGWVIDQARAQGVTIQQ